MYCNRCGKELPAGARICGRCGQTVSKAPVTTEPAQPRQNAPAEDPRRSPVRQVQESDIGFSPASPQKKKPGMGMLLIVAVVIVMIGVFSLTRGTSDRSSGTQSQQTQDQDSEYKILVFYAYNGTKEGEKISDEFDHTTLDCLCFQWDLTDSFQKWEDPFYMDFINPRGEVMASEKEFDDHSWKDFFNDATGGLRTKGVAISSDRWDAGTYKVIFYQGNESICYYEIEVK